MSSNGIPARSMSVLLLCCGMLSVAGLSAADLSQYREFRLGMDLQSVAKLAKSQPSQATVSHRKPALLEDLEWRPQLSSLPAEPIRMGFFSFYDGALYRMLITYDGDKTEGLTPADLTAALEVVYGAAAHPSDTITIASEGIDETATVLAQWEDSDALLRLVRISYRGRIALVLTAKRLGDMAERAMVEAKRIEEQEAPERDAARQKQQAADEQAALQKARLVNKPNFRP